MKKTLLLLFALICMTVNANTSHALRDDGKASVQASYTIIPKDVAVAYAQQKCNDTNKAYDYYVSSNDIYNPKIGLRLVLGNYWLVLVDMKPGTGWEHECKYIYVKARKEVGETIKVYEVDATCPPLIAMDPISVKNRYGKNSTLKANVPMLPANTEWKNSFSGNTYAVILSGGISPASNYERYWNDCSFIYQTLRNRYNVPKANIKVIMADGTDPAADMNPEDGGAFVSSPLDLDGDGAADIGYAATKQNVKNVLESVSAKMTDDDHLFLYVIDHGGYDYTKKQSYICLWNGEKLYPDELDEYLSHGDAGYVSVLMGQCFSGGFVEPLKANNRIVMTACSDSEYSYACEEIPFDEFVYHWTSAISGRDAFGNEVVAETDTLPNGKVKPVSLVKAYNYACTADMYAGGKFPYASESPMLSLLQKSTAEDLSLDSIPPTVYLCASRGTVPTQETIKGLHDKTQPVNLYKFWNSDDIWLRNQKDGFVNQWHEMPQITEDNPIVYVYSKILNRGVKPYNGSGWKIWSGWVKSAYVITKSMWEGEYSMGHDYFGGYIKPTTIKDNLMPGDTTIVQQFYVMQGDNLDEAIKPGFNMCLIADLYNQNDRSDIDIADKDWIYNDFTNDRIAQKNRIDMSDKTDSVSVRLDNPFMTDKDIALYISCNDPDLSKNVRAQLCIPNNLSQLWTNNGLTLSNASLNRNTGIVTVNGNSAVCDNIRMESAQRTSIGFRYNAIASEEITKGNKYDIDVAVYDKSTGKCIGGETFRVSVKPRPAISPVIEENYNTNGTYTLTAANVKESVSYKWYDKEGNIIGTSQSVTVPANSLDNEYTVEVESNADNAVSSATAHVERVAMIKGVTSGENETLVTFSMPARDNTIVSLSSVNSGVPEPLFSVKAGETVCSLPTKSLPDGVYQIVLKENGKVTEFRKFEKK